jgi:peptide/nickel transport system substrate-binding protein
LELEAVARRLAEDFTASLGVEVDLTLIPADQLLAAQHALVEKVLPLQFDVLVHAWLDLSSDAPPAFMHSQFFSGTGAFRAGPPIPEFDELLGRFAFATDQRVVTELTTDLDRFAYDQALSVFLCAPGAVRGQPPRRLRRLCRHLRAGRDRGRTGTLVPPLTRGS